MLFNLIGGWNRFRYGFIYLIVASRRIHGRLSTHLMLSIARTQIYPACLCRFTMSRTIFLLIPMSRAMFCSPIPPGVKPVRNTLSHCAENYGNRMFTHKRAPDEVLAGRPGRGYPIKRRTRAVFVKECRRRQIGLPGISTIEKLCADALVAVERRIEAQIAARLDDRMRIVVN